MTHPIGKILLIEDTEIARRAQIATLQHFDFEVHAASTGKEAILKAQQEKFDLIITDIGLPDIPGIEVSEIIKQDSLNKETPIVALTAHADIWLRKKYFTMAITKIFCKPLTSQICEEIKKLLKK